MISIPALIFLVLGASATFPYADHPRYKRQAGLPATQIDLNITVPFIFSARLYQYGPKYGDAELSGDSVRFPLDTPLAYFGESYRELYILRDGVIGFDGDLGALNRKQQFPRGKKSLAVYWAPNSLAGSGKVWFRETKDLNTLRLAASEVALQYNLPEKMLSVDSVVIVTWENVAPPNSPADFPVDQRNLFQVSLILSSQGSFAHIVYSKLRWSDLAVAGFNEGAGGQSFSLPGSGLPEATLLANQSDIGIPGEWIFRLDGPRVHLCGPGYKGLECIQKCAPGEWSNDCHKRCHCAQDAACCSGGSGEPCACACDALSGRCPQPQCQDGWSNQPTCDQDVDECEDNGASALCPAAQPDCINTPGAYLCMCLAGYDNVTNRCIGSESLGPRPSLGPSVPVSPRPPKVNTPRFIVPVLHGQLPIRGRQTRPLTTTTTTTPAPPAFRTIVPQRGLPPAFRAAAPSANRPASPGLPVAMRPASSNRPSSHPILPVAFRPASSHRRVPETTTSASFAFGSDYAYDYEEEEEEEEVKIAEVVTQEPYTPTTRRVRFRVRGGVVTPIIAQPRRLPTTPRLGIRPVTRAPPRPAPTRPGSAIRAPQDLKPAETRDAAFFKEDVSPFESTPCTLACGPNSRCAATHTGEMQCVCRDGFRGESGLCVDVDECVETNGIPPCGPNSVCLNEPGAFACVCNQGFQSDGEACIDIDECASGEAACEGGDAAVCVNTNGAFECRCRPGFNGNPGSLLGCIDINECLIPEFYCGPSADCENTQGGFRCHCLPGYDRSPDGVGCMDVDECVRVPCDSAAVCVNRDGGFDCRCLNGFAGDGFSCSETILFPYELDTERKLPATVDSVVEVNLNRHVTVFGSQYNKLYISAHGVVSFDRPLRSFRDDPVEKLGFVGLVPAYARANLPSRGHVVFKETAELSSLTRGSLNVAEDFHMAGFRADAVFIVTFVDMGPPTAAASEAGSTYQIVIISGEAGTYAAFIYDSLAEESVQAAVLGLDGAATLLPPSVLRSASNVGQPGKWLFRIDGAEAKPCPAGLTGAPLCRQSCSPGRWGSGCAEECRCGGGLPCDFISGVCANKECQQGFTGPDCQHDVDECAIGPPRCDANARCENAPGSFSCVCNDGFSGDGFSCQALDPCFLRYGVECHRNGECRLDIQGQPVCVCVAPTIGDGFSCQDASQAIGPVPPPTDIETRPIEVQTRPPPPPPTTTLRTFPPTFPPTQPRTDPPTRPPPIATRPPPFVETNRVEEPATTLPPFIRPRPVTQAPSRPRTPPPDGLEDLNNLLIAGDDFGNAANSNLLVIIIPAVLCGIWLILIVILLVVCLRRRKQRQRDKFGLGYFLPPPSKSGAGGPPSSYSGYSSQWTIPRPAGYDYSQYSNASYGYPDPYSQYKY